MSWSEAPTFSLGPYIVQTITILIAPAFTAATIYITFGRIMLVVDGQSLSPIRQRYITLIFVCGDILSLLVQSNGASLLTRKNKPSSVKAGKWIVTGGLVVQVVFFGAFMLISVIFYRRLRKSPTPRSKLIPKLWRTHLFKLYAASLLILVRSVFRVVEYTQGNNGYLLSHEVFLYMFDATLLSTAMLSFNIGHPSQITALLNGTKATSLLRVYTAEELGHGAPEMSLRRPGSPDTVESGA
jgi:hypothetical protein